METFVRSRGAEGLAFDPITVAGPNTAIPHAVPGDRAVQENELVLFDTGAKLGGYCSDMTRTVSMGAIDLRLDEIWKVVLDAQLEAEARVRPGMTGAEVDAIARGVIERAGYGEAFIHGLGHGVGLEIHEPPWLTRSRGSMPLLPGMVFTIEPGVYLPGVGGVRIEDMLLLTENGAAILSQAPKKLQLSEVLIDLDR
jgi:Xaa-Pro aminopeptidase